MTSPSVNLLRNISCTGSKPTHMTLFAPRSQWTVDDIHLKDLWVSYCALVDNDYERIGLESSGRKTTTLSIAEIPEPYMPVIVRCQFEFDISPPAELDMNEFVFIPSIIKCYQIALVELFNISASKNELNAVVLGPDDGAWITTPQGSQRFAIRLQIHFPMAQIERGLQVRVLRPRVLQLLRDRRVIALLDRQPVGDWDKHILANSVDEPVPLYGSVEREGLEPLYYSNSYGPSEPSIMEEEQQNGDEDEDEEILPSKELHFMFNPINHGHVQRRLIQASIFTSQDLAYWLPLFLSVHYWSEYTTPKNNIVSTLRSSTPTNVITTTGSTVLGDVDPDESEVLMAERFLLMIHRRRVSEENMWLDIGKALYNITKGENKGLELWQNFTSQTDDHSPEDCEDEYLMFDTNNFITIRTLALYAKEDSPNLYKTWHNNWRANAMEGATSLTHTDVAAAFYRTYWLDLMTSSTEGIGNWYIFHNHILKPSNDAVDVKYLIANPNCSNNFVKQFETLRTGYSRRIQESSDVKFKSQAENMVGQINALIKKLKNQTFKRSIIKEASEYFHVEKTHGRKFIDMANKTMCVGTPNGVIEPIRKIDYATGRVSGYAVHRPGKPEDFVTKTTTSKYPSHYTWTHPRVVELLTWWNQMFVDSTLSAYAKRLFGSILIKGNPDKIFPALSGESGHNSKSMFKKAIETALGEYSIDLPTELFTQKSGSSGAASPEVAQARDALAAWLQEPEDDDEIKNGTLKRFTGGDRVFARFLNENGSSMNLTIKVLLVCNRIPRIPNCDKATQERFRYVPFLSEWVDNPPDTLEEMYAQRKFKKDPHFEARIPRLASAVLWCMVQWVSDYYENGLDQPEIVTQYTEEYWSHNDMYRIFGEECIQPVYCRNEQGEEVQDVSCHMTTNEVWKEFRAWYDDVYPGSKIPKRETVLSELSRRWGKHTRGRWAGIQASNVDIVANV